MKEEFNELDDLDEEVESNFNQDNYYYDDESSFDYTLSDYDYLDYGYNKVNRNENEYYDDEADDDDSYDSNHNFRNKIIKFIIMLIVILLVIWLITLFVKSDNNKKTNDEVKVIKTTKADYNEMFLKVKLASLKYFNEERVNDSLNQEKSLKLLKSLEYIDDISKGYDLEKSNTKLIEKDDKYNILITLYFNDKKESKIYEVDNYSYCVDTYLCEKQDILNDSEEEISKENSDITVNNESTEDKNSKNKTKFSSWSLWSDYERTSCDTKTISCNSNDLNCLTEIKLYQRKEKVDTYNKIYNSSRLAFKTNTTETKNGCYKYDYVKINGTYYRTEKNSNFKVLGAIKKDTITSYYNWRYDGRGIYTTPPSDTINTRYVYVGPDYSNCTNTCKNGPNYYYDKYTFTKKLVPISNPKNDCNKTSSKVIANYSIESQNINVSRIENLYGTVCYKSIRTRKVVEK